MRVTVILAALFLSLNAIGAGSGAEKFAQLGYLLDTPTDTRLASGAPGPAYWQQRADYDIRVTLDDERQRIIGEQDVVYHNLSPHTLRYIWLQLDQNRFKPDSADVLTRTAPDFSKFGYSSLADMLERADFDGGVKLGAVRGESGDLKYTVNETLMRIELPEPLAPGEQFRFSVAWEHNILDAVAINARGGYEYFEEDENYIYEIAQWYPRLAAYTDY
ncbi:MAG: hypothetical protein RIC38_17325 [Chromatocurvus sp.]